MVRAPIWHVMELPIRIIVILFKTKSYVEKMKLLYIFNLIQLFIIKCTNPRCARTHTSALHSALVLHAAMHAVSCRALAHELRGHEGRNHLYLDFLNNCRQ